MTSDLTIVKTILEKGTAAFLEPGIAVSLMLNKTMIKDELARAACLALLLNDANWVNAKEDIRNNPHLDKKRVKKLIAWADRITKKELTQPSQV